MPISELISFSSIPLSMASLDLFVIAIGRVRGKYPIISSIVELLSALSNIVGGIHNHDSPTFVSRFYGDLVIISKLSESFFLLVAGIRENVSLSF